MEKILIGAGYFFVGTGIGCYYSVSFPAIGAAVPKKIRGFAYGILSFFQEIGLAIVPICSGLII